MAILNELLEGIELFPEKGSSTPRYLTQEEYLEHEGKRHKIAEEGIEREWVELQKIKPRMDSMLDLYDKFVLKGYSQEKDDEYMEELANTCIPCFASLPKDRPPVIKLTWALLHVNESRSMNLVDICNKASSLEQTELERFAYRLRKSFVIGTRSGRGYIEGFEDTERDYKYHKENPMGDQPVTSDDDDESDFPWLDLREEKERIWGSFATIRLLYQTMVELIRRKLPDSYK